MSSAKQVVNRLAENKRYILKTLDALCQLQIQTAAPTSGTTAVTYTTDTNSGTIADGYQTYTISNIGDSDALVDTGGGNQVLPAGMSLTFEAYTDPVTNVYKRPDGLTYDPQLSTVAIAITP